MEHIIKNKYTVSFGGGYFIFFFHTKHMAIETSAPLARNYLPGGRLHSQHNIFFFIIIIFTMTI